MKSFVESINFYVLTAIGSSGLNVMSTGQRSKLILQCNENDITKALHQADLARRLIEQGVSPYVRFQEVNELARNIASTAQTSRDS